MRDRVIRYSDRMTMAWRGKRGIAKVGFAMTSAPLLAFSQSPFDQGWIAVLALVPFMHACRGARLRLAVAMGIGVGTGFALMAVSWVPEALSRLGTPRVSSIVAAILLAVSTKGLFFGALGFLIHGFAGIPTCLRVAALATAVALAESLVGGIGFGPPFLLLGHSQGSVPGVSQLALAIGVPGISGLLVGTNAAVASAMNGGRSDARRALACVVGWFVAALTGIPIARTFERPIEAEKRRILIVQPDIAYERRWDEAQQPSILRELADRTSRALLRPVRKPDMILWPETVLTGPAAIGDPLGAALDRHVRRWKVPVVLGLARRDPAARPDRYRNSIVWWSPSDGPDGVVDKQRTIPVVESSAPVLARALWVRLLGRAALGPKVVEASVEGGEVTRAPFREDSPATDRDETVPIVPTICFEILFPDLVDARRRPSSRAIVNLADVSWVRGDALDEQLVNVARFRAIEQRLPLLRVANGGISTALDRYGQTRMELERERFSDRLVEIGHFQVPSPIEKGMLVAVPILSGGLSAWLGVAWRGFA